LGKRKYLGRANERYVKTYTSRTVRVGGNGLKGYAALIKVHECHRPLMVGEAGAEVWITYDGYAELCYLPDGENWQVYTLYDDSGRVIEWYFDITRVNALDENGDPYCDDMYLDAALMPGGQIKILDEDELRDALERGEITQDEYETAYRVLNELIENKIIGEAYMEKLCAYLLPLFGGESDG